MATTRIYDTGVAVVAIAGSTSDLGGKTFTAGDLAYRVTVNSDTAVVMRLRKDGVNWNLFENVALIANSPRTFVFSLPVGTTFSFRFSAACNIDLALDVVPGSVL